MTSNGDNQRDRGRRRSARPPLLVLAAAMAAALAATAGPALARAPYSAVVIDATTGHVILSDSPSAKRHPASLTKMMTIYMALDAVKAGALTMDQRLTVSANAASREPTKLGLRPGQTITVKNAIMSLITLSANDMSVVLAEAIAGSEDAFAARMTARAHQLGMTDTLFRNANGLPDPAQVTTAYDMARLGLALMRDHPDYYDLFSTQKWRFGGKVITNHNRMLGRYKGTNGIKTGYIRASGFNLVVSVERNGRHLVGAIFGGTSARSRDDRMIQLLDAAFVRLETKPELVAKARVILPDSVGTPRVTVALAPVEPEVLPTQKPAPADIALAVGALDAKIAEISRGEEDEAEADYAETPAPAPPAIATVALADAPVLPTPRPDPQGTSAPAAVAANTLDAQLMEARARAAAGETWGVQIGAFRRQDAAMDHLRTASRLAPGVLDEVRMAIHQGTDDKGTIYRARFVGLTENGARSTCLELRQKSVSCIALKMPPTLAATAVAGTSD
ncbi:D-alanyl-D-alanine carboxypeptidase [Zavarzinia compransoris]|uniref:D-alanyl-D-alanine carboxypeptidase family protein n=1 Tax=Zavarzinia marina TaxID=2911065 RepID=UPI001F267486|nr:D-alanyl-D-alanine carboxypeptidase family protein [Zavarzinia marina]MCF4166621.1 D-alanyl-D-alanine carboxypeptidase [Zavarzinia marina]